ncbi:MAG: B12-binding domain-containing radical SAM protein [Acidobacteria bacterium]|uniref:B12-binding domain-containing radical SAM protein n=1 Tax=Candidatus Polarisedimenticola svalbardensis TaxID=2886004 RepID=A0A8J6Y8N1_9BACT|nr:B12-binding domain-containing radical SAM protein [Candidatus Polarisedimenticola svalbardensis]
MRALLVYPAHQPRSYWSFSGAMRYIGRRAALPPLSLVTIASMLPQHWELRLIDMNIAPLKDSDLLWADVVLTSTMIVQAESLEDVIARCNRLGVPVAAGGPYPSISPERLTGVDHLFIGEAEGAMAAFARDLERGEGRRLYRAEGFPALQDSPIPRFDLLDVQAYASMAVQHSRGCPFSCEFCDIWKLYGRQHRVKAADRMAAELDALYATGWRGSVFFVDDNFIGNRRLAKDALKALRRWQEDHRFPFQFYTEASVNLGSDDDLLRLMRSAGFDFVFLGIETPAVDSLIGANKPVNANLDLLESVRRIQTHGIEVSSGFIVGFDEDTPDIFDRQIEFIQEAGIPMAMVGILIALEGTELHDRLNRDGRLLGRSYGSNTHDFRANFVTRMPADQLAAGYKRVMGTLYNPTLKQYFQRCRRLLDRLGAAAAIPHRVTLRDIRAVLLSLRTIFTKRYGRQYLRFLLWTALRHRSRFPTAVRLGVKGFHFEDITRQALACSAVRRESTRITDRLRERFVQFAAEVSRLRISESDRIQSLVAERSRQLRRLRRRIARLAPDVRADAAAVYVDSLKRINELFLEYAPSVADAFVAEMDRLTALRESCRRDIDRLLARWEQVHKEAGDNLGELGPELRSLYRMRRELLKRARRQVRELSREYRPAGVLELQRFQHRLNDALPAGIA